MNSRDRTNLERAEMESKPGRGELPGRVSPEKRSHVLCFPPHSRYFLIFCIRIPPEKSLRHASSIVAEMLFWGILYLLLWPGQVAWERSQYFVFLPEGKKKKKKSNF